MEELLTNHRSASSKLKLGIFCNLCLAISVPVIFGILRMLLRIDSWVHEVMIAAVFVSSVLMHLSETKHGLPGIAPFNWYSWHFLQIDRITAVVVGIYVVYMQYLYIPQTFFVSLAGLAVNIASEQPQFLVKGWIALMEMNELIPRTAHSHSRDNTVIIYYLHCFLHLLWHSCAFVLMIVVFNSAERAWVYQSMEAF